MQRSGPGKLLGIAVGDRSLLVAEVSSAGGATQVTRAGEFVFPQGTTLQQPEPLGQALLQFLKQNGYAARTAIFGIPAKWLLTKKKEVPAADEKLVSETLRLQAEGEFSSELSNLVFEYTGQASTSEARPVLLMAVPKRYLDQITALAESARLRAQAITPYAAALGAAAARTSKSATLLLLGPGGPEFASQNGPSPRALRYLGSAASAPILAGEVRRNLALLPSNGDASGNGQEGPELTIWNDVGLDETTVRTLTESLNASVKPGDLRGLGIESAGSSDGREYGAAVALALAGLETSHVPADFLHSRLAPPPQRTIAKHLTAGILAAVVLLALGIYAWTDLQHRQNDAASKAAELNQKQHAIDTAKAMVSKVEFARAWHGGNPKYLAFLRDLTNAVPEDGQLYLTSLDLKEPQKDQRDAAQPSALPPAAKDAVQPLKGSLSGKATRADSALRLIDKLMADKHFSNVEPSGLDQRDVNRNSREVSFTCTFNYLPKD